MNTIEVPKKKLKGEDNYKSFTIRIPIDIFNELETLTEQTEHSRNEVVTILLREALKIAEVIDVE